MSFVTLEVGKTGPEGRIGVGTAYHIDSKYLRSTPWEDKVKAFDAKASRYAQDGRNIVFSNQGVHGTVYNPSASLEDKIGLLKRVDAAHSHSVHKDWNSFDYYAPIGTDLWDKSAEGAPIYVAGAEGLKVEGHQGGGWGNSGIVLDSAGNPLAKTGHGDINIATFGGGVLGGEGAVFNPNVNGVNTGSSISPQKNAKAKVQAYKGMNAQQINDYYQKMRANKDTNTAQAAKLADTNSFTDIRDRDINARGGFDPRFDNK